MTGISHLLGRRQPIESPALPDLDLMRSAVGRILARWPGVKVMPEQDREQRLAELRDRERAGRWAGYFVSDLTAGARVLYMPEFRERRDLEDLRRFFPAEIRASTRSGFLGWMASVYVDTFEPDASHSRELGRALAAAQARLGDRWHRTLQIVPDLFDCGRAHRDVAAMMLNMSNPRADLRRIGLQPIGTGLVDAAHLAFVAALAPRLRERAGAERLLNWLKPDGVASVRTVGAGAALEALLRPWVDQTPGEDLQSYLMQTIRDLYGHPLLGRRTVWNEVGETAKAVMLRWLTGASIRVFLDVVSEVESSHMWEPRRKFWLELYERNGSMVPGRHSAPPVNGSRATGTWEEQRPTDSGLEGRWRGVRVQTRRS